MFDLIGADHRPRAACCYSSALSETELGGTTRALAGHILAADGDSSAWPGGQGVSPATDDHILATGRRSSAGLNWVTSLLDQLELEEPRIHVLSSRLIFHLLDALKDDAEVGARISLVEAARSKLAWLHDQARDSAEYARDLSISYERLGDLYASLGEPARALEHYQKDLAIREELRRRAPSSAEYARDLSISYMKLGDLQVRLGEPARALEHYQQALAIREELRRRAPDSAQYARDLVVSYHRLAGIHHQTGDRTLAGEFLGRCHDELRRMRATNTYLDPALARLLNRLDAASGQ